MHPTDLLGQVLQALVDRSRLNPAPVDNVIGGCVGQGRQQSLNIGRNAVLATGFLVSVPAHAVDRRHGSSQQAVHSAVQGMLAGWYEAELIAAK